MQRYRAFFLDGYCVKSIVDIDADDDGEAIALATLSLRGRPSDFELWCGNRLVATVPHERPPILDGIANLSTLSHTARS